MTQERDLSRAAIIEQGPWCIHIDEALANGYQIIDVRTREEFLAGTLPGAVNVPLFDENERRTIGSIYRYGKRDQAIDRGLDYGKNKLSGLLAAFTQYRQQSLAVFCARGGMRSVAVVNLLGQFGYKAFQLKGGYKQYRHDVLGHLEHFGPKLIVLHGLTGTGKTRVLQKLEPAIDLERLAGHHSSLFGGLGKEPNNQRTFEMELVQSIGKLGEEPYFIEGESRKIGRVYIPRALAMAMQRAVLVKLSCSLETRVDRIIEDYPVTDKEMSKQIETILRSLKQKMGARAVAKMCRLLRNGELHDLVRTLLVDYYDKRYARSMSCYHYELELSSKDIDNTAARLMAFRQSLAISGRL